MRDLKLWNKFFILCGFSLKKFSFEKKIRGNLMSIWSILMVVFYIVIIVFVFNMTIIRNENRHIVRVLRISLWMVCGSDLVILVQVVTRRKFEELFWMTLKDIENIFTYRLRVKLDYKKFNRFAGLKIFLNLTFFVVTQVLTIVLRSKHEPDHAHFMTLIFLPKLIARLFCIKFIFYIDLISFCLKNIKQQFKSKKIRRNEMQHLKKIYSLCWQMNLLAHKIFEWGNVLSGVLAYFGTLLIGHLICDDLSMNRFNFGPIYRLICVIQPVLVITMICKNCSDNCKSIASFLFDLNSKELHGSVEAFGQLILHQKIIFKPLDLYEINESTLISVCDKKFTESLRINRLQLTFSFFHRLSLSTLLCCNFILCKERVCFPPF
jgi:hypothetical protein